MNEYIVFVDSMGTPGSYMEHFVFCSLRSVGHTEFYEAYATEVRPELKFVLADYYDYNNEQFVLYNGLLYRVIRTYRNGRELEITVGRASEEEVAAIYG